MSITEAHKNYLSEYAHITIQLWAKKRYKKTGEKNKNGYINGVAKHSYGYDVNITFITWFRKNIKSRNK